MREIVLDFREIYEAEAFPKEKLQAVGRELSEDEIEWFNTHGWQYYSDDYLLPVLGETLYLRSGVDPVIEINGKRWKMSFDFDYNYGEAYEAKGKRVVFKETKEPLTKSECNGGNRHGWFMKVFGQPVWVQNEHFPGYKGKPCYHLATLEVGWGDCGNYNILIACDEQGDPTVAFFEASCC